MIVTQSREQQITDVREQIEILRTIVGPYEVLRFNHGVSLSGQEWGVILDAAERGLKKK